jgi:hypothetical protein
VILLASVDRYVFGLAERDGLVNKRSRRAFPILDARLRLADSLTKQLGALGLERRPKPLPTLAELLTRTAEEPDGGGRRGDTTPAAPTGQELPSS